MLETYYKYRVIYKDYILFIKVGNFYEVFDKDAIIISKLLNYKIKFIKNNIKVGFPINSLNNVVNKLNNINDVVIDNNNIIDIKEYEDNKYECSIDINKILYNKFRIDKIYEYLIDNIMNDDILNRIKYEW